MLMRTKEYNQVLDYTLNKRILSLAPKFEAKDIAPSSLKELAQLTSMVVWQGGSEATIYGDPTVNHAFRAWHDSLHLKLNAPFTLAGEKLVALEQARIIGGNYGKIVIAEVVGQAEHFEKHGTFPIDQKAFITEYLRKVA
jgi:hypothetical protein